MIAATTTTTPRELAHRTSNGIEVTLYWSKQTDRLLLELEDTRSGECLVLEPEPERALDAFYHPYSYTA
jgi:hypothetical protein